MNTKLSRARSRRNGPLAALFCTTSFSVLASVTAAYAQAPSNTTPVEEVLVTGSLIRGTQTVGVPVTTLSTQDFQDSGAITVADLLKNVPSITMQPSLAPQVGAGNETRTATLNIHNLGGTRTLMLIDGWRYPVQKQNASSYDPSIIPALALDRVDVLPDGASATYGSDAVAGVVNVILKRGFDGAVSQVRIGATNDDVFNSQESQLFGRTWDSGDITLTFEHWETAALRGSKLSYYTTDFTPWGLDNQNSVKSAIPGIVSTGTPSASTGTGCVNCYSVPKGQNGVGLTWASLLANQGVQNEINPYSISEITNAQQRNAATVTVDQRLTPEIEVFAEGFYSNRRVSAVSAATITPYNTLTTPSAALFVPTTNPYYPIGAPSGLRVSYDFALDLTPLSNAYEISSRYAGGFNLTLPYDWRGKIFASINQENNQFDEANSPNTASVSAALGNTVPSVAAAGAIPGFAAFTKPANVPYLNVFCDPTAFQCNSKATLDYINAYGITVASYIVRQYGANFDGPLFALPAGDIKAAVGGAYSTDNYFFETFRNRLPPTPATIVQVVPDPNSRSQWAVFGQLNVPIVGDANAVPFFRKLNVEGSFRYDHYSDFGGTSNPKLAVDWEPLEGLTLRGSWGTSFRAPQLANLSAVANRVVAGLNILAGVSNNSNPACVTVNGALVAPANTAAALLNPTCNNVGNANSPGGIQVQGGTGGLNGILRPEGYALAPEKGRNLNLGFDFTPKFLPGLNLSATWYRINVTNVITTIGAASDVLSNPATQSALLVKGQPGFDAALAALLAFPQANLSVPASNITWILDNASRNNGSLEQQGVDFTAGYDWDMGEWGAGNTGITGDYTLHQISTVPGGTPTDLYDSTSPLALGQPLAFRLKYRAHLGWSMEGFSATMFVNYTSHVSSTNAFPSAAFLAKFPNYSNDMPANFLFDLALGYNTGDRPANSYLKNLSAQLVVNNILNRDPPFSYSINANNGSVAYQAGLYSPFGRTLAFTVTKTW